MNGVLYLSVVTVSLLAGGCALVPLDKITYPGTVSVSSSMSAKVVVIPGGGRQMSPAPLLPLPPPFDFTVTRTFQAPETNRKFARRFDELLRKELTRLGLFGTIVRASDNRPADMVITVFYADLVHRVDGAEFTVDVVMQLTGGSRPFWNSYQVVSTERDTSEEKVLATQWGQEAKTHKLLLEKVIPDIEAYVAANNKKPLQPG